MNFLKFFKNKNEVRTLHFKITNPEFYLHIKKQTKYIIIGTVFDCDIDETKILYMDISSKKLYSRTREEFFNGRFKKI